MYVCVAVQGMLNKTAMRVVYRSKRENIIAAVLRLFQVRVPDDFPVLFKKINPDRLGDHNCFV